MLGFFPRLRLIAAAWLLAFGVGVLGAEEQPAEALDPLPRLAATFDSEPIALFGVRDIRSLNDKFAKTTFSALLSDPSYEHGAAALDRAVFQVFGASPRSFVAQHEKNLSGPILLALIPLPPEAAPAKKPVAGEAIDLRNAVLKLVVVAQVPAVESGTSMRQAWPKTESSFGALANATLKTIPDAEMPPNSKLPAWVTALEWPAGDMILRVQVPALADAAKAAAHDTKAFVEGYFLDAGNVVQKFDESGIRTLSYAVSLDKPQIFENLIVELADKNSSFKTLVSAAKEKPGSWEPLMTATSSDVDAAILVQSNLDPVSSEMPYLMQFFERYMRGRRWAKVAGATPEVLDPRRFKFITERLQGSFAISAHPAITGDLRLSVAAALKGTDVENVRTEFIKGLENVGASFETLMNARKIGGTPPLGAIFKNKGSFGSPLIGLTAGWAWLCSSTAAYQELTDSFRNLHTLAGREQKRAVLAKKVDAPPHPKDAPVLRNVPPKPPVADQPLPPAPGVEWTERDSVRIEISLDRVLKIGYAAWRLTSNEQPAIGGFKIPDELLPSPALFARSMGMLRAGLNRQGSRIELRSSSPIPGIAPGLLALLQAGAQVLSDARQFATEAQQKNETKAEQDVTPPDGKPEVAKPGEIAPLPKAARPAPPVSKETK